MKHARAACLFRVAYNEQGLGQPPYSKTRERGRLTLASVMRLLYLSLLMNVISFIFVENNLIIVYKYKIYVLSLFHN